MSAVMVSKTHIDLLLTAGLLLPKPHVMSWLWPTIGPDDPGAYERGEPYGDGYAAMVNDRRHDLTAGEASRVATMLRMENRRSVNWRYNRDDLTVDDLHEFRQLPGEPEPVVVLRALSHYEYHSSEHPTWLSSEARVFCDTLRTWAIEALPGYRDVADQVDNRDVFLIRRRATPEATTRTV